MRKLDVCICILKYFSLLSLFDTCSLTLFSGRSKGKSITPERPVCAKCIGSEGKKKLRYVYTSTLLKKHSYIYHHPTDYIIFY